jgi:hypothetical protein
MTDALTRVLREARRDWGTDEARHVAWDAVEHRLLERIEAEQHADRNSLAPRANWTWKAVAGVAAAAAMAVVLGKTREHQSLDLERVSVSDEAGSIVGIDGDGEVLVDGRHAAVGATLKLGDIIDVRGAQVTLGRPAKLMLMVERGSSTSVAHVQGALVLALTEGALEAQVVPVASGEAFAVDVGRSRVAVHGTRLRVARNGDRVVVDLNEGVISVGEAPRLGSTWGALVTAPAHVEFTADDAQGTLNVTHDPSAVRPPGALGPTPQYARGGAPTTVPGPSKGEIREVVSPAPAPPSHGEPRVPAIGSPPPSAPAVDPHAEAVVTGAVQTCVMDRLHADNVTVVVTTTLYLQLNDDGSVRTARFDPPVAPDVNACVAESIYKTRFVHGGEVVIPVSVKN